MNVVVVGGREKRSHSLWHSTDQVILPAVDDGGQLYSTVDIDLKLNIKKKECNKEENDDDDREEKEEEEAM